MSDLVENLESLGFRRLGGRRTEEWVKQATPYLTMSLHAQPDGEVLFTWELSIGQMTSDLGLLLGTNDPLNIFLFPQADAKGPATTEFVLGEIARVEARLRGVNLLAGG